MMEMCMEAAAFFKTIRPAGFSGGPELTNSSIPSWTGFRRCKSNETSEITRWQFFACRMVCNFQNGVCPA